MEELIERIDKEVKFNLNLKSNNIFPSDRKLTKQNKESLKLSVILSQVNENDFPSNRKIDIDERKLREAFRII